MTASHRAQTTTGVVVVNRLRTPGRASLPRKLALLLRLHACGSAFHCVTSWRYTGNPDGTSDQARELQDRIARFARMVFFISGFMLTASFVANLVSGSEPLELLSKQSI